MTLMTPIRWTRDVLCCQREMGELFKSEMAGTHVSAISLMIWNRRKMYILFYPQGTILHLVMLGNSYYLSNR